MPLGRHGWAQRHPANAGLRDTPRPATAQAQAPVPTPAPVNTEPQAYGSNLYPSPRTVTRYRGAPGSGSIFARNRFT
ncbi:hypothetical protein GCM10010415_22530 [Streptomyces atrovirens]